MGHEDIVFNGHDFIDNLSQILRKDAFAGVTDADLSSRNYMDTTLSGKNADAFLSQFTTPQNNFVEWPEFLSAWQQYSGDTSSDLLNAFFDDYKKALGITVDAGGHLSGDWSVIGADISGDPKEVTLEQLQQQFIMSFSHFLQTYPYKSDGSVGPNPGAADNFFNNWKIYMTVTAQLQDATSSPDPTTGVDLAAFQQVYNAYDFPAPNTFQKEFLDFYDSVLKSSGNNAPIYDANGNRIVGVGYFIPSQNFADWMLQLRDKYIRLITISSVGDVRTTVSTGATQRVLVIDRILRLLIEMTSILQQISASQAQRLSFLTTWTQAYTELLTNVPQFTAGDGSPIDGDSDKEQKLRNSDVNPHMQSILENVRARRESVQDEAKALQTQINQSQDVVNQQTQMATSMLQELSTILAQIFR